MRKKLLSSGSDPGEEWLDILVDVFGYFLGQSEVLENPHGCGGDGFWCRNDRAIETSHDQPSATLPDCLRVAGSAQGGQFIRTHVRVVRTQERSQ